MKLALILVALLATAGCVAEPNSSRAQVRLAGAPNETESTRLNSEESVDLAVGQNIMIQTHGVGWGRLLLVAVDDFTLNASLTHPNFTTAREDANRTSAYDPYNHTHAYIFRKGDIPRLDGGLFFEWWGLPTNGAVMNNLATPVQVAAGETLVVVIATTVAGFVLRLETSPESQARQLNWHLAAHESYRYMVPAPHVEGSSTADMRISQITTWSTGLHTFAPGILRGLGWTYDPSPSRAGGIVQDAMGIDPEGASSAGIDMPQPDLPNSLAYRYDYVQQFLSEPGKFDMFRQREVSGAGPDTKIVGAAFIAIPT